MVAQLDWPASLPARMQETGARVQPAPQLIDRFEAVPPIYFIRSRAKFRRVSGNLRMTFAQRHLFLQLEPGFRGQRFNADFEGLGATRETVIDDWGLAPIPNGSGWLLNLTLTVFDVGALLISLYPTEGAAGVTGNAPTLT